MSDETRVENLVLAEVDKGWAVLEDLARRDEKDLRRLLRSHREEPFDEDRKDDEAAAELRQDVDRALDRIMLVEMAIEAGVVSPAMLPQIPGLERLLGSSAFARYLDTYLYFGIRLFAGRLNLPDLCEPDSPDAVNRIPTALPFPPAVERPPAELQTHVRQCIELDRAIADDEDVQVAQWFLDDYVTFAGEQTEYELWLRGLANGPEHEAHFLQITRGLLRYAREKARFYLDLEGVQRLNRWTKEGCIQGAWFAEHPLTARCGTHDLYWLARILRVEVSAAGIVSVVDRSWLELARNRAAALGVDRESIVVMEEVLHGVFDYTCDLIQNAVAIAREDLGLRATREEAVSWPPQTVPWRTAYDEELEEIARQRDERRFNHDTKFRSAADAGSRQSRWSRRVCTGEYVGGLIGLAFSGGGIRSATFNLGVLQRLQELDLLRHVDYLSTVSGGGYIGAWLLGCVRRTDYWLTQLTEWDASIAHLRRFSNYLAPRPGLMSVDTWAMWASWIRNALLIQLSAAAWVAALLVGTLLVKQLFSWPWPPAVARFPWNVILGPFVVVLTVAIYKNLRTQTRSKTDRSVVRWAVVPAWAGSFVTAALLWADDTAASGYSDVLTTSLAAWTGPLAILFGCFWVVSAVSIEFEPAATPPEERQSFRQRIAGLGIWLRRLLAAPATAAAALSVVYLGLCGVRWLFLNLRHWMSEETTVWVAYVVGPTLVLLAMSLAVVVIIGLIGHGSPDWRREWWTRYGAWLGIWSIGFLALSITAVVGPRLILGALDLPYTKVKWGAVLAWIGTVVGGLLSGNSSRTNGETNGTLRATILGWFAKVAALLFIVGALLLTATGVHLLLVKIFVEKPEYYWKNVGAISEWQYLTAFVVLLALGILMSWRFEINVFGLNQFYRNRLVRCYLGATRWRPGLRRPHRFTGFDGDDDLPLTRFRHAAPAETPYRGPFPIVNCSLNLGGSSDLAVHTRHSASFALTPLRCGADRRDVGYACSGTENEPGFAGGVYLGQAISVSGAAASPNMGYNTSPLVAVLLTMFNVRLAWWFPNPGRRWWSARWVRFSLWYLVKEMFALADEKNHFINVSDGGHFENLGVYELVRRRCKVIIASDAECDPTLAFGSLGSLVRMCETDFGAKIDIDVESIRKDKANNLSPAHCAVGTITYANGSRGYLIYVKSSISGDEDIGIEQYMAAHRTFPHEATADQFFAEDQFEGYRRLGHHVTQATFRDVDGQNLVTIAGKLVDLWVPRRIDSGSFVEQTGAFDEMLERFRQTPTLYRLFGELTADRQLPFGGKVTHEERCACLELIQLMENVFLALRLDDFWSHPDNRGWTVLFTMWAKSATLRLVWTDSQDIYGRRFVHFCRQRLGLTDPPART